MTDASAATNRNRKANRNPGATTMTANTTLARLVAVSILTTGLNLALAATWTGGGSGDNWSTIGNWSDAGDPAGKSILFDSGGASGTAGTVTSIVDADYSVTTLDFQNTTGNTHTLQINSGRTLTVTGFLSNLGGSGDNNTVVNFTGDGTLNYNNSVGDFTVGRFHTQFGGNQTTTLNMGGLATFTANANIILVGRINPYGRAYFTLAQNNEITANEFRAGYWSNRSDIYLGETNEFNISTWRLSDGTVDGNGAQNEAFTYVQFATGLTNPSATIRHADGIGRAAMNMAWAMNGGATDIRSHLDLRGGYADLLLGTLNMSDARPNSLNSWSNATIRLDEGMLDVSTVNLSRSRSSSTGTGSVYGLIALSGTADMIVDTLRMGLVEGRAVSSIVSLNDSAELRAASIDPGATTGAGNAASTRRIEFTSGTLGNKAGSDLTVGELIDIRLMTAVGARAIDIETGHIGAIHGVMSENAAGAGFAKTGGGNLLLNADNTFTGTVTVTEGALGGAGSVAGDVAVAGGAHLAPGASIGTFGVGGDLTLADGAVYDFEATSAGLLDLTTVGGVLDLDGTITVNLFNTGDVVRAEGPFLLFSAASVNTDDLVGWNIVLHDYWYATGTPTVSIDGGNLYLNDAAFIPEPTSLALLGLGVLALTRRRR